jgi:hypothetical protein
VAPRPFASRARPSTDPSGRLPFERWGSLIFSPSPTIELFALPENCSLRALPNYLAFAEVPLRDGMQAIAASIHAPPPRAEGDVLGGCDPAKLRRSVEGPKYNDAIFAELASLVDGHRFIIAGDWKAARRQGTEHGSRAGEELFGRVRMAGWHDFRTWFGRGRLQQDDYVFCDSSLGEAVDEVSVAKDAATGRHLSDHAPLVVDFDVGPIAAGFG